MELYYIFLFFIFGTLFGSFFNVVGYRLPKEESIVTPPSHCPKCNYKLKAMDLIPIVSYFLLKGKCRSCKDKISGFYPLFEFITGLSFALSYYVFGFSIMLIMVLIFISSMIIICISDYQTMIIPDEIIIFASITITALIFFDKGFNPMLIAIFSGFIAFTFMWILKLFGDFVFKKESMGGGDIKLLFLFGLFFGWEMAIISIFIASFIGLPVSIIVLKVKKENIIPFGPFLAISAVIITLLQIDIQTIIDLII